MYSNPVMIWTRIAEFPSRDDDKIGRLARSAVCEAGRPPSAEAPG